MKFNSFEKKELRKKKTWLRDMLVKRKMKIKNMEQRYIKKECRFYVTIVVRSSFKKF